MTLCCYKFDMAKKYISIRGKTFSLILYLIQQNVIWVEYSKLNEPFTKLYSNTKLAINLVLLTQHIHYVGADPKSWTEQSAQLAQMSDIVCFGATEKVSPHIGFPLSQTCKILHICLPQMETYVGPCFYQQR